VNTSQTRTKRLLVAAIGAAVVGISIAAAPAAVAEKSDPNAGNNHIPITPGDMYPQPAPWHVLPPGGNPHPGGWGPH
jgi:hypothetical protein